jgi:hypothetical protein
VLHANEIKAFLSIMLRPTAASLLFSVLASAALALTTLTSCASKDPVGASRTTPYVVPAGTDLTTPTSFKNDVLPILVQSCAFTSCHGEPNGTNNGISLGLKPPATSDAAMVIAGMVNVKAKELPAMNFITPSDPSQSYLMHKIDGDNGVYDSMCTDGTCQATMPQGSDLLPVPQRDILRRWIAQGAQNN